MSAILQDLDFDVVIEDGVRPESLLHLLTMMFFRHLARNRLRELGPDFFVGVHQFVYYSVEQARAVAREEGHLPPSSEDLRFDKPRTRAFRGPDAFVVKGVANRERDAWLAWEENGRLPDLVLELVSPRHTKAYHEKKKLNYQDVLKSPEYLLYEPRSELVDGYRLLDHTYQRIPRSSAGRLWSSVLEVEVGVWHGEFEGLKGPWLRLFYPDGRLVPTTTEQLRGSDPASTAGGRDPQAVPRGGPEQGWQG